MGIDNDPCLYGATDSDMALGSSSGWDLTMSPRGRAGHSQQVTPFHPGVSSSIFMILKLLHSLSLLSDHHRLTHCGDSWCRLAPWLAGTYLNDIVYPLCVACWQAGADRCLWLACVTHCRVGLSSFIIWQLQPTGRRWLRLAVVVKLEPTINSITEI